MLALVPQIVAAVVSLSVLGYFIGWGKASAYYEFLGAPWAISMLPPFALLQQSASIIFMMVTFGFFALISDIPVNGLALISGGILIIACALLFVPIGLLPAGMAGMAYAAASVGGHLIGVAASLAMVELMGRLKLANWSFKKTHSYLIYIAVVFGLIWAPRQLGRVLAEYDLTPTALPAVELPGSPPDVKWRLVHIADGRALLISPAKERQNSAFRVIEAKDLSSIATVPSPSLK
jgi:hypothetical protein